MFFLCIASALAGFVGWIFNFTGFEITVLIMLIIIYFDLERIITGNFITLFDSLSSIEDKINSIEESLNDICEEKNGEEDDDSTDY